MASPRKRRDPTARALFTLAAVLVAAWLVPAFLFVLDLSCGGSDGDCPGYFPVLAPLLGGLPLAAAVLVLAALVRSTGRARAPAPPRRHEPPRSA